MSEDVTKQTEEEKLVHDVTFALNDLPILARLQFAANLILGNGGMKDTVDQVPALIVAHEVISDVIKVLEKHPLVAELHTPKP